MSMSDVVIALNPSNNSLDSRSERRLHGTGILQSGFVSVDMGVLADGEEDDSSGVAGNDCCQ